MPYKFTYHKKLDSRIVAEAEKVLNTKIIRAEKMGHGEVNHVYKLVGKRKSYLARVFQYKGWLEPGKLQWIDRQLIKHRIPRARILYYTNSHKFFPHGFMLAEFLEGHNGQVAVKRGLISLGEAYYQIGQILRQVHKIKLRQFGSLTNPKRQYADFLEWKLKEDVTEKFRLLKAAKKIDPQLEPVVKQKLVELLMPFNRAFKPVLNHGDPNRENAIWTADRRLILIDWDNAFASTWLEDYADLTFWADFKHNKDFTRRRLEIFNKNFFKSHGLGGYKLFHIKKIEKALHIIKCMKLLTYYQFDKQNNSDFLETKRKLLKLLN